MSQFTLYHVLKGAKPDFHNAMKGEQAKDFYNEFLDELRRQYCEVRLNLFENSYFILALTCTVSD